MIRKSEESIDDEILSTLVASHRRFLSFIEARVESPETAEDILQAAMVKAVEQRDSIESADSAPAWFYRVLRNALTDHYRRRGARARAMERAASFAEVEPAGPADPLFGEVCSCFEDLLDVINPDYAAILRAVDLEGRPVVEVADELGITPNNAGVRLHRARRALRVRLAQACATCADHGCLDCTCKSAD